MKVTQRMLTRVRSASRVFDLYETSVREWRETLGLDCWQITVQHTDEDELASCVADATYKNATFSINTKRVLEEGFFTPLHIESTAVHEMVHSLLWLPFNDLANPVIPEGVIVHFEETHTEQMTNCLLRAKYRNDPALSRLWTEYKVVGLK